MANFKDIQTILNNAMAASQAQIGHVDLHAKHKDPSFPDLYGAFTNKELQSAVARGQPFFQPGIIPPAGTIGTKGDQANLVLALKGMLQPFRQMPGGGPAISDADIATMVDWINHGCPD